MEGSAAPSWPDGWRPDWEPLLEQLLADPFAARSGGLIAGGVFGVNPLDLIDDIWDAVSGLDDFIWGLIRDVWHWIQDLANDVADWALIVIDYVIDRAGAVAGAVWDAASWVAGGLWDAASWVAGAVWDAASWVAGGLWDAASWVAGAVWDAASWVAGAVWDAASWVGSQLWYSLTQTYEQLSALLGWLNDALVRDNEQTRTLIGETQQFITENVINNIVQGAQDLGEFFTDALNAFVNTIFEPWTSHFARRVSSLHRLLSAGYNDAGEVLADLDLTGAGGSLVGMMESVFGSLFQIPALVSGIGAVYAEGNVQIARSKTRPTLPGLTDLRDAFLRGLMSPARHDQILQLLGYSDDLIATFKDLYFEVPPPSDLVRMAVREAFTPAVVERFGLVEDFPEEFAIYARQIGISEEWARRYWAAHWGLPSATQGFEMLHRGVINVEDLQLLLRALDVMPFWRDKLTAIAYSVPGRIDLRRMFQAGVIDEERLYRGYLDLGYNPDDARHLTEFAIRSAAGNPPELPRSVVTRAYREGLLSRQAAHDALLDLGLLEDDIDLLLDLEDLNNAQEDAQLAEDIIAADFRAGVIDENTARAELADLGVPAERADLLVRRWRRRAAVRTATLSAAQVQRAFREQLLDESAARGRLIALGYNEDDVRLMLELARPDPVEQEPASLTLSQLFRAHRAQLLDESELRARLQRRGYAPEDLDILLSLAQPDAPAAEAAELTKADIRGLLRAGLIDDAEAEGRLLAKGFDPVDVELLLTWWKRGAPASA